MNTSFCAQCGAKHTYNFSPPKFCSNCGESTSGTPKVSRATAPRRKDRGEDGGEDGDENSSDIDYLPEIDGVSVDIEQENVLYPSLGSILGQTQDRARPIEKRFVDLSKKQNSRGN